MKKNLIQKLENYYLKRNLNQARKNPEKLLERAESIIDQGGDVRKAADDAWLAVYFREELDNREGIEKFKERALSSVYSGYDPLKSNNSGIRELAYKIIIKDKVRTLNQMAVESFRNGSEDKAIDYHLKAFYIAQSFDPERTKKEIDENFEKLVKKLRGEKQKEKY